MDGIFSFQRSGDTVQINSSTLVSTEVTFNLASMSMVEIANVDTAASAAFIFTDAGAASAVAATTLMRSIPPSTTLYERVPQGTSYAAAISINAGEGGPLLFFTPGVPNG